MFLDLVTWLSHVSTKYKCTHMHVHGMAPRREDWKVLHDCPFVTKFTIVGYIESQYKDMQRNATMVLCRYLQLKGKNQLKTCSNPSTSQIVRTGEFSFR